jgi:hypothetical protein
MCNKKELGKAIQVLFFFNRFRMVKPTPSLHSSYVIFFVSLTAKPAGRHCSRNLSFHPRLLFADSPVSESLDQNGDAPSYGYPLSSIHAFRYVGPPHIPNLPAETHSVNRIIGRAVKHYRRFGSEINIGIRQ